MFKILDNSNDLHIATKPASMKDKCWEPSYLVMFMQALSMFKIYIIKNQKSDLN
jgi:hypothetical protein